MAKKSMAINKKRNLLLVQNYNHSNNYFGLSESKNFLQLFLNMAVELYFHFLALLEHDFESNLSMFRLFAYKKEDTTQSNCCLVNNTV